MEKIRKKIEEITKIDISNLRNRLIEYIKERDLNFFNGTSENSENKLEKIISEEEIEYIYTFIHKEQTMNYSAQIFFDKEELPQIKEELTKELVYLIQNAGSTKPTDNSYLRTQLTKGITDLLEEQKNSISIDSTNWRPLINRIKEEVSISAIMNASSSNFSLEEAKKSIKLNINYGRILQMIDYVNFILKLTKELKSKKISFTIRMPNNNSDDN